MRYFTMQKIASRLFLFYLLFSILSSFFFFRRSWGDALRALLLYFKQTIFAPELARTRGNRTCDAAIAKAGAQTMRQLSKAICE